MKNKQANREWVVSKLKAKLRIQVTLKCVTLKCVEALDYFKQEFGVHIKVTKMWRAMKEAKHLVEGSERFHLNKKEGAGVTYVNQSS